MATVQPSQQIPWDPSVCKICGTQCDIKGPAKHAQDPANNGKCYYQCELHIPKYFHWMEEEPQQQHSYQPVTPEHQKIPTPANSLPPIKKRPNPYYSQQYKKPYVQFNLPPYPPQNNITTTEVTAHFKEQQDKEEGELENENEITASIKLATAVAQISSETIRANTAALKDLEQVISSLEKVITLLTQKLETKPGETSK
jgi:hypothetical protein